MRHFRFARSVAAAAMAALSMVGCQDLLDVNIEGQVTDDAISSAAAANGLRLGALRNFALQNGASVGVSTTDALNMGQMVVSGMLSDDLINNNISSGGGGTGKGPDWRTGVDVSDYTSMHQTRARAFEAIAALATFMPTTPRLRGEMYFVIGWVEMRFAELYCNGVPLSGVQNGAIVYGQPLTNTQMYDSAIGHFDQALTFLGDASDAEAVALNRAVRVAKARALIARGQPGDAAIADTLVAPARVPTTFTYTVTFGGAGTSVNAMALYSNPSGGFAGNLISVGDSINPNGTTMPNALPFASAGDPRVPVLGQSTFPSSEGVGSLGIPMTRQQIWTSLTQPINMVSGLDARLIQAEVQLKQNSPAGIVAMMTILNALRAAPPALSTTYTPAAMAPLPIPATQTEAVRLFFREKAFWTWGRGQRAADQRRIIRQWGAPLTNSPAPVANLGFTEDNVWPSGNFYGQPNAGLTGPFGNEVNFLIGNETVNPNMTNRTGTLDAAGRDLGFCMDREA